jgi:uncharacterized RDD family membrane protein YckC
MGNPDSGASSPPPQQDWQSTPQPPAQPPAGGGMPAGGGTPSWTSNITAQGTIAGPGGLALADLPNRIIAAIIDFIIVGLVGWLISYVLGTVLTETRTDSFLGVPILVTGPSTLGQLIALVLIVAVSAGYFIYMWSRMGGATVGMKVLKLQVRDASSGGQINQSQAINRWVFLGLPQAIGFLYVVPLPLIGLLVSIAVLVYYIYLLVTIAQSPTRQGLHDKRANTVVAKVA